jgi:lipoate-protein ligase B
VAGQYNRTMSPLRVIDLGRRRYADALALQKILLEEVKASDPAEDRAYLVLVEHVPPVITLGRSADPAHVLADPDALARAGVEVVHVRRGGDVTWHGPGQLVGYPIVRVNHKGRSVHGMIRAIEAGLIAALGRWGISGERVEGLTGVWSGGAKVAAIGIAVSRWVSWHGFALNVCTAGEAFAGIVPCGIADKPVTSVSRLAGRAVAIGDVADDVASCLATSLDLDAPVRCPCPPIPRGA